MKNNCMVLRWLILFSFAFQFLSISFIANSSGEGEPPTKKARHEDTTTPTNPHISPPSHPNPTAPLQQIFSGSSSSTASSNQPQFSSNLEQQHQHEHLFPTHSGPLSATTTSRPTTAQNTSVFKFKIGFEFQLSGKLFPNLVNNKDIQKKALFFIEDSVTHKLLWHVEIDGANFEFVTESFTHQEKDQLQKCLENIQTSITVLKKIVKMNSKNDQIPISAWIDDIRSKFQSKQLAMIRIRDGINELIMQNPSKDKEWKPQVSPQVTIQHPLEYAVPLYFSLFGFDNKPLMASLLGGLPNYDIHTKEVIGTFNGFKDHINKQNMLAKMSNKKYGLTFLHALTLKSMAPDKENFQQNDKQLLETIKNHFKQDHQIDVKRSVMLMSRRPFSSMFKDIQAYFYGSSYATFFKESIEDKNSIFKALNVSTNFFKTNYGEQFFENGHPKPIRNLENNLNNNFLNTNRQILQSLLDQGILCTVMIRNHNTYSDIFNNYYQQAISSVENPSTRYKFNLTTLQLELVNWSHDMLSPPWFLSDDDSMGKLNDDATIDKMYGEAIIEVRGISRVGTWFLEKANIRDENQGLLKAGRFLRQTKNIKVHGMKLFDFLVNFGSISEFSNEINMGICYNFLFEIQ